MWDWWIADDGDNWLKGVENDPDNPIRLTNALIASLLSSIPEARDSFNYWFPLMLPREQERLLIVIQGLPQLLALDPVAYSDNFQYIINTAGIHVAGPRGGGSWAPPPFKP
jgi:hypothetical protein